MGLHTMERRDNESADSDQAIQAIPKEARTEAPQAPQPASHLGYAAFIRRCKHKTGTVKARTLRDRDHSEISALPYGRRCGSGKHPHEHDRSGRKPHDRDRNGSIGQIGRSRANDPALLLLNYS